MADIGRKGVPRVKSPHLMRGKLAERFLTFFPASRPFLRGRHCSEEAIATDERYTTLRLSQALEEILYALAEFDVGAMLAALGGILIELRQSADAGVGVHQ